MREGERLGGKYWRKRWKVQSSLTPNHVGLIRLRINIYHLSLATDMVLRIEFPVCVQIFLLYLEDGLRKQYEHNLLRQMEAVRT